MAPYHFTPARHGSTDDYVGTMEAHAKENMYVTDIPVIEHVPERTHSMHGNDAPIVGRKYTAIAWYLLSMVRVTTFTFPPLFYGYFDFIHLNIYKSHNLSVMESGQLASELDLAH